MSSGIKLCVKQGEELNRSFTIKANGSPFDLTGYTIKFQVKLEPLAKSKAIVDKTITEVSDINEDGQIIDPTGGQFQVHLNQEDTSMATGEYALIISLQQYKLNDIISSSCCNEALYIVCEQ